MKKIVMFILLFIPIIINASSINNIYIDSEIDIAGNLIVKEVIDFNEVDEDYNIYYKNDVGNKVYNASDIILDYVGVIDSYDIVSNIYKSNFKSNYTLEYNDYTINKDNEYLNIKFNDKNVYYLEYRVLNVCVKHKDSAEFYFRFFDKFNYDINNGSLLIRLPEKSSYFKLTANSDGDIKAGKDIDKGMALFRIDELKSNNDFDVRLFYDRDLFVINVNKDKETNKNMNDWYGRNYLFSVILTIAIIIVILILIDYIVISNTYYNVKSKKIKNNKRIVLLSDLHDRKINKRLVSKINKIKPDIIIMSGDMIDGKYISDKQFLKNSNNVVDLLNELKSYDVYYTYGNHEHYLGKEYLNKYDRILSKTNVKLLNNKCVKLDDLNIYGFDGGEEFYSRKDKTNSKEIISKIGNIDESKYNVLVAHNPLKAKIYSETNVDLTLSGHIHGGIVRLPFGLLSPEVKFFPKYSAGLYNVNKMKLIVSKGLGFAHYLYFRINNHPEIVVINLLKDDEM